MNEPKLDEKLLKMMSDKADELTKHSPVVREMLANCQTIEEMNIKLAIAVVHSMRKEIAMAIKNSQV